MHPLKKRDEEAFRAGQAKIAVLRERAQAGEIVLGYVDEAGFSQVHPNRRAWTPKGERHSVTAQRGKRLNVLAAMLSTEKLLSAKLWCATTADAFVGFLGLLYQSLSHHCIPIVIGLDNASIHKAKDNRAIIEFLKSTTSRCIFFRPTAPNSIESRDFGTR